MKLRKVTVIALVHLYRNKIGSKAPKQCEFATTKEKPI